MVLIIQVINSKINLFFDGFTGITIYLLEAIGKIMNNDMNSNDDLARYRNVYHTLQEEVEYCEEKFGILDKKVSTIIGFIGVIFGLQVTLLSLYKDTVTSSSACISVAFALFFALELFLFLLSIIFSGAAYHVKYDKSIRPSTVTLAHEILEEKCENDIIFIEKNINSMIAVLSSLQTAISNKKDLIELGQRFFMCGCIIYVVMLLVLIWGFWC